jgi:hypothetical protein
VCSNRQVFSPVVGEEPLDLGAELTVHLGLKLSELLERFMLPSYGIYLRATRIIVSKGDHVPGAIFSNRYFYSVRMDRFEYSR